MNERIKELAKQAGEYAESVYRSPIRSKTPSKIWEDGHISWYELYDQKFAELIVRECAEVAKQTEPKPDVVQYVNGQDGFVSSYYSSKALESAKWSIKATFDGETGKLKAVEIVK